MVDFIITEGAEKQLRTVPVLADIKRHVNLGDLLTFNKSNKPVLGIFNGFTEKRDGQVFVELRDGCETKYVHPREIATLHAGNGYTNSYRSNGNQGGAAGRISI